MRAIRLILSALIALILLGFVLLNWQNTVLNLYVITWHLPLAVIIFAAFVVGVIIGLLLSFMNRCWRKKRNRL